MDAERALPTPAPSMAPRSGFVVLLQAPLILAAWEDFAGLADRICLGSRIPCTQILAPL